MKKLLPPGLFLVFVVLMACVCWALGSAHAVPYPYNLAGWVLLAAGLGVSLYHSRLFKKTGANIMTFGTPTKFVTSGLYRYSRNPMYLGFVLALLGAALLYQAAISSFLLVGVFWLIADRWYIRYEEAEMLRIFGDEYRDYCKNTPRWIGFA
jgi:protein-S-isoprenylcysteine O-methyltransferase Ste14